MILATMKATKIVFLVLVVYAGINFSCGKVSKEKLVWFGICTAMIATGANIVTGFVPLLSEEVTLTALGEKNSLAQSDEVVLLGMKVDGKEVEIGKAKTGKWFWGNHYMWRNEADSRQPAGTTRDITLEVPVGWEREIEFATNQWNGYVQVECLGQTQICDTYSNGEGISSVTLPGSTKRNLILQHTLEIGAYGIILFGWLGVYIFLVKEECFYYQKVKRFVKSHLAYFCCGIVSASMFFQMLSFAERNTFWNDEIWQIQFCLTNENPIKTLLITHNNYYTDLIGPVMSLWYRIAPYGEEWLLLPQELAVAVGVYIVGITTNYLRGLRSAFLAVVIGGCFSNMIFQCAYEFRSYGFLFLMCSITFFSYIRCRQKTKYTWKNAIWLGVSLWLPMSFHIFGVFFSAGLVLTDCFFMLQRKLTFRWIWSYMIAGGLYIPWLYNMLCYDVMNIHAEWQGQPTFRGTIYLLKYLTNQSTVCFLLFLIGLCFVLGTVIYRKLYCNEITPILVAPVVVIFFVITFVFVYGRWINPKAAMWMARYFVILFPMTIYLCALGGDVLCDAIVKKETVLAICGAVSINMFISNMDALSQPAPTSYEHFKEAADWFYTQQNTIYNKDTLIIYAPDAALEAWQEYYTTRQGLRDPLAVVSQYSLSEQDLENKNFVYVYYEHMGMFDSTKELLEQEGLLEVADDNYLKIKTFVRQ